MSSPGSINEPDCISVTLPLARTWSRLILGMYFAGWGIVSYFGLGRFSPQPTSGLLEIIFGIFSMLQIPLGYVVRISPSCLSIRTRAIGMTGIKDYPLSK